MHLHFFRHIDAFLNRTVRFRTILIVFGIILGSVVFLGWWKQSFLLEQFRALALGHSEIAAEKYGYMLPQRVDRVDLYEVSTSAQATNFYRIKSQDKSGSLRVGGPVILSDSKADAFMDRWGQMRFHWGLSALCHEPGFVIIFKSDDETVFETSLCLTCSNFTIPAFFGNSLMGFDVDDPNGVAFVSHLKTHFPDSAKWKNTKTDK